MNLLELKVKYGIFKEMDVLEDINLKKEIDEKFKYIYESLDMAYNEKDISTIKIDANDYISLLSNMSEYFLLAPITDNLCEFFNFLTEVIFNWSKITIKNKQIENFSLIINRLVECRKSFKQSTIIMKESYDRYLELSNWQPPVFDLAIEYFDKLLEENEKTSTESKIPETSCG